MPSCLLRQSPRFVLWATRPAQPSPSFGTASVFPPHGLEVVGVKTDGCKRTLVAQMFWANLGINLCNHHCCFPLLVPDGRPEPAIAQRSPRPFLALRRE